MKAAKDKPSRKSAAGAALAVAAIVVSGLFLGEAALRLIDEYALTSLALNRETTAPKAQIVASDAKRAPLDPEADRSWYGETPPPLARRAGVSPLAQTSASGLHLDYLYNENFVQANREKFSDFPEVLTFAAPWGSPYPSYRYPASTSAQGWMVTNAYGFRGPEIDYVKPPRTVRIAALGASTTVNMYTIEHSYPELLQNWLNLWPRSRKLGLTFEVLNAGRAGLTAATSPPSCATKFCRLRPTM